MTPNIVAATSGLLVERRHRRARHARDRAGGVGHDPRRDAVDAGDVDDRVHHRHVDRADVRAACRPTRRVETISFGTPTGSARIARAAIDEPPEPPSARIAVEPALARAASSTTASAPSAIAVDRRAAVAGSGERGDVGAGGARDLVARDVRLDADRLVHAGVDDQHVDAVLEQAFAQERVLGALRVERAEEDDRRHSGYAPASGSTPR